jgi:hypothetical protein
VHVVFLIVIDSMSKWVTCDNLIKQQPGGHLLGLQLARERKSGGPLRRNADTLVAAELQAKLVQAQRRLVALERQAQEQHANAVSSCTR